MGAEKQSLALERAASTLNHGAICPAPYDCSLNVSLNDNLELLKITNFGCGFTLGHYKKHTFIKRKKQNKQNSPRF